ncbi:MAG: MobF family relaxase [Pirellulaceae bacterium]|nr:MobF family relaxase [Pirellulaceae bacterium]
MVATAKMFKFSAKDNGRVAEVASYYVDSTNERYYTESGEAPGEWFGAGAAALGLDGVVTKKQLYNLLRGKSADGKKRLVRTAKRKERDSKLGDGTNPSQSSDQERSKKQNKTPTEHMPGFDITFSAPKSVSSLWAVFSPKMREVIEACHEEAVKETLRLFQEQVQLIRRGKGGMKEEHGELVIALFAHCTSRNNNDPNLHHHAVIPNMAINSEGGVFKVNSRMVLKWARTLGPLYRNTLLVKLTERLQVEAYQPIVNEKAVGWFDLVGMPTKLTKLWSSRTKEILNEVELSGSHASDVAAQKAANLRTRMPKGELTNRTVLFEKWDKEAKQLGITADLMAATTGRNIKVNVPERVAIAIESSVSEITAHDSAFERHTLIRAVSEKLQDVPISGDKVISVVDHCLQQSKELVRIDRKHGPDIYTTKSMWEMEAQVIKMTDDLVAKPGLKLKDWQVQYAIASNPMLTDEQKKAVCHVLQSESSIACITGVAGSGKSTTLRAIVDAYKEDGKKVVGIALAGIAAENLEKKTDAESRTIESFLYHTEKSISDRAIDGLKHHAEMIARTAVGKSTWSKSTGFSIDKNTVVMVDEAATMDTERGKRVLKQVVDAGATIVFVGDLSQLPPINAGTPFTTMIEKAGSTHLAENFRMRNDPLGLQAAQHIRDGEIQEALAIYAKKGDLKISGNRNDAAKHLVKDWASDGGIKRPEDAMILVQTREEARQINRMCQSARLLESAISNISVRVGDQELHVNDRVMFQKPMRHLGIENGNSGTVIGITERGEVRIQLDKEISKQQKKRGITQEPIFNASKLTSDDIKLAYAATTHKLQGIDVEKAYVLAGGSMTNQQQTYTALSRSTAKTKLYIDRDHAGPMLSEILKAMEKSLEKPMAHDLEESQRISRRDRD